jgi:histidinol-phosphatase (PHP family)
MNKCLKKQLKKWCLTNNQNPQIATTFHCHTKFSDGKNSITEMVEAATELGFAAIGISDHLVLHPTIKDVAWAMSPERLDEYAAEFNRVKQQAKIPLFMGLEVDFFPGNQRQAELDAILAQYDFNYLIGSIHFLDEFPIDYLKSDWENLSQSTINIYYQHYWQNMLLLVESQQFDFIGHIDIIKKMAFKTTENLQAMIENVLTAIARNGSIVEINTAGWNKPCAEAYPSPSIIDTAQTLNIPLIMNDDAHSVGELGQHYKRTRSALINL